MKNDKSVEDFMFVSHYTTAAPDWKDGLSRFLKQGCHAVSLFSSILLITIIESR